ncbi:transglycosylase family protein [Streptomyces sp. NPDC005017]|uniref:LysM peptidoglycan-binding domain-containing protein n=1 Tax=Streptomyces sp. NPDC005017 TaxID=3364706 RepID=UPI00368994C1
MTGSAIAIPLLGASGASAADASTWDRVAECETGGAWSANDGYGQYGGLRLSQLDWDSYGGLEYAPGPDQASRRQQIAVAERVLADQGVAAWPTCGPLVGLTADSGEADAGTGADGDDSGLSGLTDTSDSSGASGSDSDGGSDGDSGSSEAGSGNSSNSTKSDSSTTSDSDSEADGTASASPSPSREADGSGAGDAEDSDKSGENGGSSDSSAGDGTGRHRGASAEEGAGADGEAAAEDGRDGDTAGRHASRSGAAARDAADGEYTVREGDSLWGIADSLELQGGWSELYAGNRETVGVDPNLIVPGQKLAVGIEPGEK